MTAEHLLKLKSPRLPQIIWLLILEVLFLFIAQPVCAECLMYPTPRYGIPC